MACSEDACVDCQRVVTNYRDLSTEPDQFIVHIDVNIFYKSQDSDKKKKTKPKGQGDQGKDADQKRKKQKKTETLDKLSKVVSALRNSQGGCLLVHLFGHKKTDKYLGYFDEFVGNAFTYLIENGQLYVDVFRRSWLSDQKNFAEEKDFICIFVSKTNGLSTVDFSTKIRNDFENIKPTPLNVLATLVSLKPDNNHQLPVKRGIELHVLQENRNIELKSFSKCDIDTNDIPAFINFIWGNLKLRENVTSMSKISEGGSFYVGIAEKIDNLNPYPTKSAEIEGFELSDEGRVLKAEIQKKITSEISVINCEGRFGDAPADLIEVFIHPKPETQPQKFVLEVSIRHFDGIVFYEKGGPRAYTIDTVGKIRRFDREEWFAKIPFEFLVCPLLAV